MGYKFRWNEGREAQMRERIKKAMGVDRADVGNREEKIW